MKIGIRVRYIRVDNEEDKRTGFYPPIGTLGTVINTCKGYENNEDILVKWDSGTSGNGEWWCGSSDVKEIIHEDKEALYSLMENYFFDCHMNGHSEFETWCEDNIENDEQRKLFDDIKEYVEAIADTLFN